MNFLKTLTIGSRRKRIRTPDDLLAALREGAAFLAQGASYSYIRARSGTMGPRLMQDAGFGRGMERCKWEAFAAAVGDLILIVAAETRLHGLVPASVWRSLYREALESDALPEHRAEIGWKDRLNIFHQRLDIHLSNPGRGIESIAAHTAAVLIEFAPVDDVIRELDREMVTNNVQFRFIEHVDGMRRRTDWPGLTRSLIGLAEKPAEC